MYFKDTIVSLIDVFEMVVSRLERTDTKACLPSITDILILLFGYRSTQCKGPLDHTIAKGVEEKVNSIFCTLALKLSEIYFKPLFMKVQCNEYF